MARIGSVIFGFFPHLVGPRTDFCLVLLHFTTILLHSRDTCQIEFMILEYKKLEKTIEHLKEHHQIGKEMWEQVIWK